MRRGANDEQKNILYMQMQAMVMGTIAVVHGLCAKEREGEQKLVEGESWMYEDTRLYPRLVGDRIEAPHIAPTRVAEPPLKFFMR